MPTLSLASGPRRALALVVGLGLLGGAAFGILRWLGAARGRTAWERAALERAVRLESDNALLHHRLGQWEQFSLLDGDFPRALLHYRRASELNPYESGYWFDLADALLLSGDLGGAEAAVEQAVRVDPRTPRTLWRAGNFWLRTPEPARAFPFFQQVLLADPALAGLVIQVSHRALRDPQILLRDVLPPQPGFLLTYMHLLVQEGDAPAAARVWQELVGLAQPFEAGQMLFYLEFLIRTRDLPGAVAVWKDLKSLRLLPPEAGSEDLGGGERLHNSALQAPILNGGFDWRVETLPQVSVTLGEGRPGEDSPAVVIRFSGEENIHYRSFFQYVVVEPNRRYRFQAWLSTEGITTESGPRLEVADAYDTPAQAAHSPGLVGTNDWTREEVEFTTGSQTRLLRVGIARLPSRRLSGEIRGSVRAAQFSLREVGLALKGGPEGSP